MGLISTNVAELLEEEKINEVFEYLEIYRDSSVSYTHLTLPTIRLV